MGDIWTTRNRTRKRVATSRVQPGQEIRTFNGDIQTVEEIRDNEPDGRLYAYLGDGSLMCLDGQKRWTVYVEEDANG